MRAPDGHRWSRIALVALAWAAIACGGAQPGAPAGSPVAVSDGHLTIMARDVAFEPASVTTPPTDLKIEFDNEDGSIPHDLVLYAGDVKLAATPIITGPATTTLDVPKLVPGDYRFTCTVHPNMSATLTVAAP